MKTFGLDLPSNLTLTDAASIKTAGEKIQGALKAIRDAYRAPGSAGRDERPHPAGPRLSDQPARQLSGRAGSPRRIAGRRFALRG